MKRVLLTFLMLNMASTQSVDFLNQLTRTITNANNKAISATQQKPIVGFLSLAITGTLFLVKKFHQRMQQNNELAYEESQAKYEKAYTQVTTYIALSKSCLAVSQAMHAVILHKRSIAINYGVFDSFKQAKKNLMNCLKDNDYKKLITELKISLKVSKIDETTDIKKSIHELTDITDKIDAALNSIEEKYKINFQLTRATTDRTETINSLTEQLLQLLPTQPVTFTIYTDINGLAIPVSK